MGNGIGSEIRAVLAALETERSNYFVWYISVQGALQNEVRTSFQLPAAHTDRPRAAAAHERSNHFIRQRQAVPTK